MIISHAHKFIFFHNPKAGGTSIRKTLLPFADNKDHYRYYGKINGNIEILSHLPGELAYQLLIAQHGEQVRFYKKIILVRDPIQRFISAASQFAHNYADWFSKFGLPLDEFLMEMLSPEAFAMQQFTLFRPQRSFFPNSIHVNVFPLELLGSDGPRGWGSLLAFLGLPQLPLLQENCRSESSIYRLNPKDEKILSKIAYLYSDDYEYLSRITHEGLPLVNYTKPKETFAKFDSYFWGVRNIKRFQAGDLPDLKTSPGSVSDSRLQDALRTPLFELNLPLR
jgi:Sulfotransferase family